MEIKTETINELHKQDNIINSAATKIASLHEKMNDIFLGETPTITSSKYIKKIANSATEDLLDVMFKYYGALVHDMNAITKALQEIKSHIPEAHHIGTYAGNKYISEDYVIGINADVDETENLMASYNDPVDLISQMYQIDDISVITDISAIYMKNKTAIDLYATMLNNYITRHGNSPIVSKLIDDLKLAVLLNDPIVSKTSMPSAQSKNYMQSTLSTNNLVPSERDTSRSSGSLSQKIKELYNLVISDISKLGPALAKTSGPGLIIINKYIDPAAKMVLDNDIHALITPNKNPKGAGVSEEIIAKTNTTYVRESEFGSKPPVFSRYETKAVDKTYYILDTVDGVLFRELKLWSGPNAIPLSMIPEFTPSQKVWAYNTILESEILKHVTKPIIMDNGVSRASRSAVQVKWNIIRNDIKKRILNEFDRRKGKSSKMTSKHFLDVVSDTSLYFTPLMHISNTLAAQFLPNESREDTLYIEEIQLSTLSDINYMMKGIAKYVSIRFSNTKGSVTSPTEKLGKVLDDALKTYINEKNNIYLTIENKAEITGGW